MKKMPKFLVVLLALWMVVYNVTCIYFISTAVSKNREDKTVLDLPDYCDYDFYRDGVWREHIDYAKYYYHDVDYADLDNSQYFQVIDKENIEEVRKYVKDFEEHGGLWDDSEIDLNYDFKVDTVEIGDYFYVSDYANNEETRLHYKKFKCYDLYYFDVESKTLYFFDKFV